MKKKHLKMTIKKLKNIAFINLSIAIIGLLGSLFFGFYLLNFYNKVYNNNRDFDKNYALNNNYDNNKSINDENIEVFNLNIDENNYLSPDENLNQETQYIERNSLKEDQNVISKNEIKNRKKIQGKNNNQSNNNVLEQNNLLSNILSLLANQNSINNSINFNNNQNNQNSYDNQNNNLQNSNLNNNWQRNDQNQNRNQNNNTNSQTNNNQQRDNNQNNQNNNQNNNNQDNLNNNNQNNNNQNNNNQNNNEENINLNNTANNKILISEVLIDGGNRNDEFIELYNPNDFPIDLSGWKLVKINKNGSTVTLISSRTRSNFNNKIIQPYSYMLIANIDGSFNSIADLSYSSSYQLAKDNSVVLINNQNQVVDLVGWGNASLFEGQSIQNPQESHSLVRKAGESSNLESINGLEKSFGNSYDTDNNQFDFLIFNQPEPQNSLIPKEIPPATFTLINYSEENNIFNFEIISPYRKLGESNYVILAFDSSDLPETENEEEINSFIRQNWRHNSLNISLPEVKFTGKRENINIDLSNIQDIDDKIVILGLVINNNLYFWPQELLNN